MTNLTERWQPVLDKIKELRVEHRAAMSILLENHLIDAESDIQSFTRFSLPIVRKVFAKLVDAGIEISPIPIDRRDGSVVESVGPTQVALERKVDEIRSMGHVYNIDAEEDMSDWVAEIILDDIKRVASDGPFRPVLFVRPSAPPQDNYEPSEFTLEEADERAFTMEYLPS